MSAMESQIDRWRELKIDSPGEKRTLEESGDIHYLVEKFES